jgi:outer membrane lipoprotein LolB
MPVSRTSRTLAAFAIEGRIAVHQGESRSYANVTWQHGAGGDTILLTTPLGQGLAELSRDAGGARLITADRREIDAPDWDGLSERALGARLPLDDLPSWLGGRPPAPDSGWQVEYLAYQSRAADALPTLIEFHRGDLDVRLKIDRWSDVR